jgi:hypothetical protein
MFLVQFFNGFNKLNALDRKSGFPDNMRTLNEEENGNVDQPS